MSHCNVRNIAIWLGRSVLISCYVQHHDIADVLAGEQQSVLIVLPALLWEVLYLQRLASFLTNYALCPFPYKSELLTQLLCMHSITRYSLTTRIEYRTALNCVNNHHFVKWKEENGIGQYKNENQVSTPLAQIIQWGYPRSLSSMEVYHNEYCGFVLIEFTSR